MVVKICGITNAEDARAAVEAGATALGFNFYPPSPRYVPPQRAAELLTAVPPGVCKVGIFVNEPAHRVREICEQLGLDVVQIYGDLEPPVGLRVWRAVRVDENFDATRCSDPRAEAFLLDAAPSGVWGGAGISFDWKKARRLGCKVILAGGLDATNVSEAIRQAQPWGVDACSRLEKAPGRKDHDRMREFVRAALEAAAAGEEESL